LKRQVDWLVNGSLTGPIFSRALNHLTQLEIFPARDKDWPVNALWKSAPASEGRGRMRRRLRCAALCRASLRYGGA